MCFEIYELDPIKFISGPGLTWQAALKRIQVELDLFTDDDMVLMIKKGIKGGICSTIHRYAKTNNKHMSNFDKNKESSYLNYCLVYKFYGQSVFQKLPTFNFEWVEDTLQFNEVFIKNYTEKNKVGLFLKLMLNIPKNYMNLMATYHFYLKERNLEKSESLLLAQKINVNMLFT